jgi:hypothetical protein
MTATLNPVMRAKLAKIAGLLASDHAGERDSAALAATRILRGAGLTWDDAILWRPALAAPPPPRPGWDSAPSAADHRAWAAWALAHPQPDFLSHFEQDFLGTVARWRGVLTAKQAPIFRRIVDRVTGGAA